MKVVSRKKIKKFYTKYVDSKNALETWYHDVDKSKWQGPQDIKYRYPSASFLGNNLVIFNIKGNKYRLVVSVAFSFQAVYIRWIGTHEEYNKQKFK